MDDNILFGIIALGVAGVSFCIGGIVGSITAGNPATIGGESVEHLECEEDEVIGYDPRIEFGPRPLSCIHYDVLSEER